MCYSDVAVEGFIPAQYNIYRTGDDPIFECDSGTSTERVFQQFGMLFCGTGQSTEAPVSGMVSRR